MITIQDFKGMSGIDKTTMLEARFPVNRKVRKCKALHGVGINDAPYYTQPRINGKQVACPAYHAWRSMLARAYSEKYQEKQPTYKGVVVCDEWHSFMSFRAWWIENQVDGWHLDKDILSDSREYSRKCCIFIPAWLNCFTNDRGAARGELPIGVHFHNGAGKFMSKCCNPVTKRQEFLGYSTSPHQAHLAWRARKLEFAAELKGDMDLIDKRIYHRVIEIILAAN